MNSVCVFEDSSFQDFLPLVYNRPVYELRCGIYSFLDRIILQYPDAEINLFCREYLKSLIGENYPFSVNKIKNHYKYCLFVNGRHIMSTPVSVSGKEEIGINDNKIVYARLLKKNSISITPEKFLDKGFINELKNNFNVKKVNSKQIKYSWDLLDINREQITSDFSSYTKDRIKQGKIHDGVHLIMNSQIFIGKKP